MGPRRRPSGLAEALSNAACEWLLMLLLFVDSLLSFLVMKFALYCNLKPPCFLCTRLNRFIISRLIDTGGYHDFLCGHHKLEISSLVYCNNHRNLASGPGLCEDCLFSIDARNNNNTANQENNLGFLLYKLGLSLLACSFENLSYGSDPASSVFDKQARLCSCCRRPWTAWEKVQKLLRIKPPPNRNDNICSSGSNARKPSAPLPRLPARFRLSGRSSLKRIREKLSHSVRAQNNFGKNGFGSLPHHGYTKLRISSDTECDESRPAEDPIQVLLPKIGTDLANDVKCPNCSTTLNRDVHGRSDLPVLISLDDFPSSFGGDNVSEGSLMNEPGVVEIIKPSSLVDAPLPSVAPPEMANGDVDWEHKHGHAPGKWNAEQSILSASNERHESSLRPMNGSEIDSSKDFENQNNSDVGSSCEEQVDDLTLLNGSKANDKTTETIGESAKDAEGEGNVVQGLRRQIEQDQEQIRDLHKELEEERNASAIATSEAMAMITRLQEEKALLHMEAMQYLRMMEEQAEHDVEALEKASDLMADREMEIQGLETELEYYRVKYPEDEEEEEVALDETSTCI